MKYTLTEEQLLMLLKSAIKMSQMLGPMVGTDLGDWQDAMARTYVTMLSKAGDVTHD